MLKYKVRIDGGDILSEELSWAEKYLSPDLSYVSGVTETKYHLEKFPKIAASNSINNMSGTLSVSAKNVQRSGYVVFENKEYDVTRGKTYDFSTVPYPAQGAEVRQFEREYSAIRVNGKYYFLTYNDEGRTGYRIDNFLQKSGDTVVEAEKWVPSDTGSTVVKIDTVGWIEDGIVSVDGNDYIYDPYEGEDGTLRYFTDGEALEASAITRCSGISFQRFQSPYTVTKFTLTKQDTVTYGVEEISYCRWYNYVLYKNEPCDIVKKIGQETFSFVCEVPLRLLSGHSADPESDVREFNLYYTGDYGDGDGMKPVYEECMANNQLVDKEHLYGHGISELSDIRNKNTFVRIDTTSASTKYEAACFPVKSDVMKANSGDEILITLKDTHVPLDVGDVVIFQDDAESQVLTVRNMEDYCDVYDDSITVSVDERFVVYDGVKYAVSSSIADKALIDGNEYDIIYDKGKEAGKDCIVVIGSENVPMKQVNEGGGTSSVPNKVKRYGKISIKSQNGENIHISTGDGVYDIVQYDGVTIDGVTYPVFTYKDEYGVNQYITAKLPHRFHFIISGKLGSSTYTCKPYLTDVEFTENFRTEYSKFACDALIEDAENYTLTVRNKIFGDRQVTPDAAFIGSTRPVSSDSYYNLFGDLRLFVPSSYVTVPIMLQSGTAIDGIREDTIQTEFVDAVKKSVINGIVDMEKDVYMPKYIDNGGQTGEKKYRGSDTVFKPIRELRFNLHFRTRNMESWKINDGNTDASTAVNMDNWFITDYHPYREILAKSHSNPSSDESKQAAKGLQSSSDLLGFMYFTNDDVYYQRDKVAKSFLRLSFYDSTDPQEQSLLGTSCVFVDEHALFKKYIDNSMKCEKRYGSTAAYEDSDTIYTTKKVTVSSEPIKIDSNGHSMRYTSYASDFGNISMDESGRISSRLVVKNKYETDTSSEGYYLYIFREYSEKLHPKPVYMKVEFNHAGVGKTIPFLIPMKWTKPTNGGKSTPSSAIDISSKSDCENLKEGIPLSFVSAQTYIPLYAVYDFINKEYAYVFDDRYVSVGDDGTMDFNLFELKVKDETDGPKETGGSTKKYTAVVNINTTQFPKEHFNTMQE